MFVNTDYVPKLSNFTFSNIHYAQDLVPYDQIIARATAETSLRSIPQKSIL